MYQDIAYTDGSLKEGIAALSYHCIGEAGTSNFATAIGTGLSVFRVEVRAVQALLEQETLRPGALVFCDSQAAVKALGGSPSNDADIAMAQQLAMAKSARIIWIPGHMGIPGNEEADALTQAAADEGADERAAWQEPAVLKRGIRYETHAAWTTHWANSAKGKGLQDFNTLPVGGTKKLYRSLNRMQASSLAQLRTNHLGDGAYLHSRCHWLSRTRGVSSQVSVPVFRKQRLGRIAAERSRTYHRDAQSSSCSLDTIISLSNSTVSNSSRLASQLRVWPSSSF